jgi:ubiquitin C-terminal hydrolase
LGLKDCIEIYQSPFFLLAHICENCKHENPTVMKKTISKHPQILVIHFDRIDKNGEVYIPHYFESNNENQSSKFELFAVSYHKGTNFQAIFFI